MKRYKTYAMYGGVFGVALAAAVFAATSASGTNLVAFVSQTDTGAAFSADVRAYQQLACEDIKYDIHALSVYASGGSLTEGPALVAVLGRLTGSGEWDKLGKQEVARSAPVSVRSSDVAELIFEFSSPVARESLCRTGDETAFMYIESAGPAQTVPRIHGSMSPNAYRSPLYDCVLENGLPCMGDVRDIAFTLYALPNGAPVIADPGMLEVVERETLTYTFTATDPEQDVITWGSSNLPAGATLGATDGTPRWTPVGTDIGGYQVVITATDDGGPVRQAGTLTVIISVKNADTTYDANRTIVETVQSYRLDKSTENAYLAHLKKVDEFIEKGQYAAAEGQLKSFEGRLELDVARSLINEQQRSELLAAVAILNTRIYAKSEHSSS